MTQKTTGGSNLTGISQYNERLILQIIRRVGSLPKADIARMTKLSAQTASVIINRLLEQELLCKQERRNGTGKVGQPAVPIALNPEGAYSLGVKIGRGSLDLALINFVGEILYSINHSYDYPDPNFIFPAIDTGLEELKTKLPQKYHQRLLGIGVAAPYGLGNWKQEINIPAAVTQQWNNIDIKQTVQSHQLEPVLFVNDATAACIASLEFDNSKKFNNYLYIFVGTFVGGGIIMNRTLYNGSFNNAGALGSLPLPSHYAGEPYSTITNPQPTQLINCASRYLLNERFEAIDVDPEQALAAFDDISADSEIPEQHQQIVEDWLNLCAPAIAYAITSAISIIDFEGVIIDGLLPQSLTHRLTTQTRAAMHNLEQGGLNQPELVAGSIGNKARALGAAFLPFYAHFAPDRSILVSSDEHPFHAF